MIYFLVCLLIFCFWALLANRITYRQRVHLLNIIFSRPNYTYYLSMYNRVNYHKHSSYLLFLRNPKKLYSEELQYFWDIKE